jgi:hypothetical protein
MKGASEYLIKTVELNFYAHLTVQNDYGLCSLEISSARLEDAGLYIVRASNIEGQVSCSALLQVDLGEQF